MKTNPTKSVDSSSVWCRLGRAIAGSMILAGLLSGCTGYRVVLEPYTNRPELQETVVHADDGVNQRTGDKIAMISYEGVIAEGERFSLIGSGKNPMSRFVEALNKAREDENVKAIVLFVNSPGGSVTGSDILYHEILRFKEQSQKPVVVLMGDVAASGGYYIACAGDEIMAHPTTVTGSIGVLIQLVNFSEGLSRLGIQAKAIKSGPNKLMGSPLEPEQPTHRALFQEMVDEFYGNFVDIVREARPNLSDADIARATDGRVFTGKQAYDIGLVDGIGYWRDAFESAKSRAGLSSASLVRYHRSGTYVPTAYASVTGPSSGVDANTNTTNAKGGASGVNYNIMQLNAFNGLSPLIPTAGPTFYYLWSPSSID